MKIINYLKLTLTAVTLCFITVSAYAQEANENPLALLKEGNLRLYQVLHYTNIRIWLELTN